MIQNKKIREIKKLVSRSKEPFFEKEMYITAFLTREGKVRVNKIVNSQELHRIEFTKKEFEKFKKKYNPTGIFINQSENNKSEYLGSMAEIKR